MSAIDMVAPYPFYFTKVMIQVYDEGISNHLEFCTEEVRMNLIYEYNLPPEEKHRGVFGYVSFGLGGYKLGDGSTELPRWLPPVFINWGRNLIFAPVHKDFLPENLRIWMRKGVKAHVTVYTDDPTVVKAKLLPPSP